MKNMLWVLKLAVLFFMTSCANNALQTSWIPVVTGPPMPPGNEQDVLLMDAYPVAEYVSVGRLEPAPGFSGKLSLHDEAAISWLKKRAAAMGGNTVVVRENTLKFKSGKGPVNKIDVLYVREEVGTHGGEDWTGDSVPLNEDLLRIY